MTEFDVGGGGGYEEATFVSHGGSAYEAAAGDGCVYDGDVVGGQFGFEDREEILGSSDSCSVVFGIT